MHELGIVVDPDDMPMCYVAGWHDPSTDSELRLLVLKHWQEEEEEDPALIIVGWSYLQLAHNKKKEPQIISFDAPAFDRFKATVFYSKDSIFAPKVVKRFLMPAEESA